MIILESEYDKLKDEIEELKDKNEKLENDMLELSFIVNFSKQDELLEFVRELKESVNKEINNSESELTKEDLLKNLKKHIENFAEYTKLNI
jgi:undecaprenyl pyrophosphate synthase